MPIIADRATVTGEFARILRVQRVAAFLVWLTCLAHVPPLAAQSHIVDCVVSDTTGGVIVGATVVLETPSGAQSALTDARGHVRFDELSAGVYTLSTSVSGFAPFTRKIELSGGRPVTSIAVTLQILVNERVEVTSPLGTSTGGLSTLTLSGKNLESLPGDPGRMLKRLRELAGATGRPGDVSVSVDGFQPRTRLPPKEAIQLIRISLNPFAPEFAEPGRARIEIITKPGSSEFTGELRTSFSDSAMNGRNALSTDRPETLMRDVTGYVSGPIVPQRWSLLAYGGHWDHYDSQIINASIVDSSSLGITSFVGSAIARSQTRNAWFSSDVRIGKMQTIVLSFGDTQESAHGQGLASGLDLPERAYSRDVGERTARIALTSVPSGRIVNEFRTEAVRRRSTVQAATMAPAIVVLDAFMTGGNQDALFNRIESTSLHAANHFTLSAGSHTMKFGAEFDGIQRRDIDRTNFAGTFVFGADYERDRSGRPILDSDGEPSPISSLENYRRTLAALPGYGPSQLTVTRGTPEVEFRQWWLGWFGQDDWVISRRITLSYGIRHQLQSHVPRRDFGARAGVASALDAERRNVVRVGVGFFYQRLDPELTLDLIRLDGRHQEQLLVNRPASFPDVQRGVTSAAVVLPTIFVKADDLEAPRTLMSSVSYERQLSAVAFVSAAYNMQRGTRLLRTWNINTTDGNELSLPSSAHGMLLQYRSAGQLNRHELSLGVRWDPSPRFGAFSNYIHVAARADTDGRKTAPADSDRPMNEFGLPAGEREHQLMLGASVTLGGGVFLSPYFRLASGRPFNITTGYDNNLDGLFTDRPALGAKGQPGSIETPAGIFVVYPEQGDRIVPRNFGREPWEYRLDVHLSKRFAIRQDRAVLVFSLDAENVLNTVNFTGYNGVVISPGFGKPNRALDPRHIELNFGISF